MNLQSLPQDCLFHIFQFLAVDERAHLQKIFPQFRVCFEHLWGLTKSQKGLGIKSINYQRLTKTERFLVLRWNLQESFQCGMPEHCKYEHFSTSQALTSKCPRCEQLHLLCILRHCSNIESLDLRGVTLTTELIDGIAKYCPKLNCLNLNYACFQTTEAKTLFNSKLAPQLMHLSMDNLLMTEDFDLLFSSTVNLRRLKLVLFPVDNLKPTDFTFTESLAFLSIHFYKTKQHFMHIPPTEYMRCLRINSPNMMHIVVKSNYNYYENDGIFQETRNFAKLQGLNCSFMYYNHPLLEIDLQHDWPMLRYLTMDFYLLRGSNRLLCKYFDSGSKGQLQSLRICDCHVQKDTWRLMAQRMYNLKILQLIDVHFTNINETFTNIFALKNLQTLLIEFTINDEYMTNTKLDRAALETYYAFPSNQLQAVKHFLIYHERIQKVYLIDWPGLEKEHLQELKTIAESRNIFLYIRIY